MTASKNPLAPEHLPFFITAPGETDVLFNIVIVFTVISVVLLGVIFLTIHSLPDRIAHKSKKVQFDIVAILGLLALFTHQNAFWIAALLLAFVDIPDFLTPLKRIVTGVETIAGQEEAGNLSVTGESGSGATAPLIADDQAAGCTSRVSKMKPRGGQTGGR